MLGFDAAQLAAVALKSKEAKWVFTITDKNAVAYEYATGAIAGVTNDIVLNDFSGIDLRRNQSETGIIAPSDVTFNISNPGSTLVFSDFKSGSVLIDLYISTSVADTLMASWLFRIKTAEPGYQNIKIVAEDFLQFYLRGDYPNTRLPADIFPSERSYENDGLCLPVPFGTAYVPLRDVYIDGAVTYTAATIGAVASASGARCQFTDSANGFLAAGIEQGRTITVSGFLTNAANNGDFQVLSVTAGVIEVEIDAGLVTEVALEAITITHVSGYIMLGSPAGGINYAITKVRSPRAWGQKSEYPTASYTFTQSTKADVAAVDWRVFQAIIADIDSNGTADAPGFWMTDGGPVLDPLVQFTRSDTAAMTNPADIIAFVLEDMGVPSANIDDGVGSTFAAAKAIFAGYAVPLVFNGAFWYKQPREKVLAQLLNMCHACLAVGDRIKMRGLVKASQKTITAAEILRPGDVGEGSFQYRDLCNDNYSDSGYVAWQKSGEPQDSFLKVLVAADAVANVISKDVLECPFVQDSRDVQRIGKLYYQRRLLREADVAFLAKGTCLALQPDDVITMNHANYGGNYAVLIDAMRINKDLSIQLGCSKFTAVAPATIPFDDWADLAPDALVVPEDDTAYSWQPTVSGPQTDQDIGRSAFDAWGKEYLTVGPTTNAGKFTDIQKALNAVKQAGGGAIYILNGDYQATAPLYVPDVNLEIVGQSQGGVVLKNLAGSDLFVIHNRTKTYSFRLFSIASQNVAAFSKMFYVYGDAAANNTAKTIIDEVTMTLVSNMLHDGSGDSGIFCDTGNGSNTIRMAGITGGQFGIYIASYVGGSAYLQQNSLLGQIRAGILCGDIGILEVTNNLVKDFLYYGYEISPAVSEYGQINVNGGFAIDDALAAKALYGIYSSIKKGTLNYNLVKIISRRTGASITVGIMAASMANSNIGGNVIDAQIISTANLIGYYISSLTDSTMNSNSAKINNTDATLGHYVALIDDNCLRNTITGNYTDMVNSTAAKDYGFRITAGSNYNKGQANKFYRCGANIDISDLGTGNLINKSGGGTF